MTNFKKPQVTFIAKRARRILSGPAFQAIPAEHNFLASFPRSGNTWLRAVLFHCVYDREPESFDELHRGIPDEHLRISRKKIYTPPATRVMGHIVKTHHPYRWPRNYRNVVYIVRDPRDVLPSFYKYMHRQREGFDLSFQEFLEASISGAIGPCSWFEHVRSWQYYASHKDSKIEFIKYEDLKSGARGASEKLAQLLKAPDKERVSYILGLWDLQRMRKLEAANEKKSDEAKTQPGFVGSGRAKIDEQEQVLSTIREAAPEHERLMNEFGYS